MVWYVLSDCHLWAKYSVTEVFCIIKRKLPQIISVTLY